MQKTDEQSEASQNGATVEQSETEEQTEIEMETEPSESVSTEEQEADVSTKTLVVYFSCTGTTELVAEYITEILGADSYQIVPEIHTQRQTWHIIQMVGQIRNKMTRMCARRFPAVWRIWTNMIP